MPITLPIPKLAATPLASIPAPRFKSILLAAVPNSNLVKEVRDLSAIYADLTAEWAETTDYETLYESVEPGVRELLLGVKGITDQISRTDLQREVQLAVHDFDTAQLYSKGDFAMANLYLSYALLKIHGMLSSLATEVSRKAKLGYGYDTSGEVGERGGTSGNDRHLYDTGNSPKNNHTQNNPANMSLDADAESDYPELAKFKRKRVHWPPRTR